MSLLGATIDGRPRKVHFSGIGGTGMAAAARLAVEAGWEVRGSDGALYPPASQMVAALNVPVAEGYARGNLDWQPDLVVVGNVLSRGNPELEAVLDRGIPYLSFPEWLRLAVLDGRRPIVVCGTHGKTTTTALAAHLMRDAGIDAGYFVGGQPKNFAHSSALGASDRPFVIEGDEYDSAFFDKRAKFFHYRPHTAIVTSLEFDHADIYVDLEAIRTAFTLMLRQVPQTGRVLLCADDPGAVTFRDIAESQVETYGFSDDATWRVEAGRSDAGTREFTIHHQGQALGPFLSTLVGRHNLQNAAAAIAVAHHAGVNEPALQRGLAAFEGVTRRMEIFLCSDGITFVDDFAHHPTAIRETIAAAKERWPNERLTVLFEPRSNTTATNRFQAELGEAFAGADEVWIGPVYRAERYTADTRLDRDRLASDIERHGAKAHVADYVDAIVRHLREDVAVHDVVLILSNGAFGGIYDEIRAHFRGQEDA